MKFQLGGRRVLWFLPPLAAPMLQLRKTKKVFANFPRGFRRFSTKFQRFKKQCCPRAEDKAISEDLRLQGQGLQNLSTRPRTSSRTPLLVANTSSFAAGKSCRSWIMISASISKGREKVLANCKSCKFVASPVPNKTGKSYFHSGNLMQHLKRKLPRTA